MQRFHMLYKSLDFLSFFWQWTQYTKIIFITPFIPYFYVCSVKSSEIAEILVALKIIKKVFFLLVTKLCSVASLWKCSSSCCNTLSSWSWFWFVNGSGRGLFLGSGTKKILNGLTHLWCNHPQIFTEFHLVLEGGTKTDAIEFDYKKEASHPCSRAIAPVKFSSGGSKLRTLTLGRSIAGPGAISGRGMPVIQVLYDIRVFTIVCFT